LPSNSAAWWMGADAFDFVPRRNRVLFWKRADIPATEPCLRHDTLSWQALTGFTGPGLHVRSPSRPLSALEIRPLRCRSHDRRDSGDVPHKSTPISPSVTGSTGVHWTITDNARLKAIRLQKAEAGVSDCSKGDSCAIASLFLRFVFCYCICSSDRRSIGNDLINNLLTIARRTAWRFSSLQRRCLAVVFCDEECIKRPSLTTLKTLEVSV